MPGASPPFDLRRALRSTGLRRLKLQEPAATISSAPTVTIGTLNANSAITGGVWSSPSVGKDDARITYAHAAFTAFSAQFNKIADVNATSFLANSASIRFMSDAPVLEIGLRSASAHFNIWVDGQPLYRGVSPLVVPNTGGNHLVKIDWGADSQNYAFVYKPTVTAGGSGYVLGDTVTLTDGSVLKVTAVSAGAITQVAVTTQNSNAAIPSNPVSQASTSGSGTGATFTLTSGTTHTTRKLRKYEIWFDAMTYFSGLFKGANDVVLPWPVSGPRLIVVGDSFVEGTHKDYAAGNFPFRVAERLGIEDVWSNGLGSTGYLKTSGARANLLTRISEITALAGSDTTQPNVWLVCAGYNDLDQTQANVVANFTDFHQQLIAARPNDYIAVVGPWVGATSQSSNAATFEAAFQSAFEGLARYDSRKHGFIPIVGNSILTKGGYAGATSGAGNSDYWTSTDQIHLGQAGQDYLGHVLAAKLQSLMQSWQ